MTLFSEVATLLREIQSETPTQAPFIFVTGFGAGESYNYAAGISKVLLKYVLKDSYADKTTMEKIVAQSRLNWVIVRPGRLLDGELTEQYRVDDTLSKGMKTAGINRADVADLLVKQVEGPASSRRYLTISAT